MREEISAQISDHALTNRHDEIISRGRGQSQNRDHDNHGGKIEIDRTRAIGRGEAVVDHAFDGERHGEGGARGGCQGDQRGQNASLVAVRIGNKRDQCLERGYRFTLILRLSHLSQTLFPFFPPQRVERPLHLVSGPRLRYRGATPGTGSDFLAAAATLSCVPADLKDKTMKADTHPNYHFIKVVMTDGTEYMTRSTYGNDGDKLNLDIDPKTHPAWTGGSQQLMDRGGRLSKFNSRFGGISLGKK